MPLFSKLKRGILNTNNNNSNGSNNIKAFSSNNSLSTSPESHSPRISGSFSSFSEDSSHIQHTSGMESPPVLSFREKQTIGKKLPQQWETEDVSVWLKHIGLHEIVEQVAKRRVTGVDLLNTETNEDAKRLNVVKLGHKKRLFAHIEKIKMDPYHYMNKRKVVLNDDNSNSDNAFAPSSDEENLESDPKKNQTINVKCHIGDDRFIIPLPADISLDDLKSQISKETDYPENMMTLRHFDNDGDYISVSNTETWKYILHNSLDSSGGSRRSSMPTVSIHVENSMAATFSPESNNFLSKHEAQDRNSVHHSKERATLENDINQTKKPAVVIDENALIHFCNPAFEETFGASETLIKDIYIHEMFDISQFHEDLMNSKFFQTRYGRCSNLKYPFSYTPSYIDGTTISGYFKVCRAFTGDLVLLFNTDNHSPKISKELALQQCVQLDHLDDGIFVSDTEGSILHLNPAAEQMLKTDKSKAMGSPLKMFLHPRASKQVMQQIKSEDCTNNTPNNNNNNNTNNNNFQSNLSTVFQCSDSSLMPVSLSLTRCYHSIIQEYLQQEIDNFQDTIDYHGAKIPTVVVGTMKELNQNQDSTDELPNQHQGILHRQREMLNNLIMPAFCVDNEGIVQAFNSSMTELTGYKKPEILGRRIQSILAHSDSFDANQWRVNQAEIQLLHKNGEILNRSITLSEYQSGNIHIFSAYLK